MTLFAFMLDACAPVLAQIMYTSLHSSQAILGEPSGIEVWKPIAERLVGG